MKNIEDKYFIALSDHIKDIIDSKGVDVVDLAAAANLDRKQIYRLINKENVPKLSTLIRIALAAGIEPKQLHDFKFDFEAYMKENNIFRVSKRKKRDP
jgi:DNA-binding phage protein